ncbi:hypothetical protein [Kordia sp.]|uniref:hypothetical protein n=1 Tax=Kordia sp. TaxID=1965332 RepID=UPI0025BCC917|nr:hypothetical protein [Kordia sp.]MCH2194334.1 hypothetical protein [Kordia sp.]
MNNSLKPRNNNIDDIQFPPHENNNQEREVVYVERTGAPTMLTILVIFTIIGSLFSMGKSLFYDTVESYFGFGGSYTYWIYAATCVGTMFGAIMMLSKKKNGLYIYSACQVIFVAMFVLSRIPSGTTYYSTSYTMLVALPALIFLALYWSKDIRDYLTK